ncbi:MAG: acetate--CoA ligase family protein [Desulfobacterales bacterium]
MGVINEAMARNQRSLSEYEAKKLLSGYGIPVTREKLASDREAAVAAAAEIGFPVVVKGSGPDLMHKTESGVVFVNISDERGVAEAFDSVAEKMGSGFEGVLVQEMVSGKRELALGLHREPQFGPCVMLGLGGVLTELVNDTAFRIAPFDEAEAADMAAGLRADKIFGPFRGEAAADMKALFKSLCALGRMGIEHENIAEADINPVIITPEGGLKAVDALVILKEGKDGSED